ncbi:hypothetical protein EJ05DRAFT_518510 [Pseudovirgaria hyperparasitica]|uniref:Integral membrane protein n=1 Tax=Pseudovirgaria hyperparasitica TaxID=470096 RepID=A0A6A6W079_9PEZI|nr:uncharacterized protein EJ05DRAFT_518510 [Pseudovirgaria hyperparasitica]KAF2755915.1 hypothetical protein EJ05DRAFT_518510 [Pseudovirgaria hyperparasitica]
MLRNQYGRLSQGLAVILLTGPVTAHEHHMDKIPEGSAISVDPIDSILWMHIILQTFAWGVLFPTGMVLGMIKSRWHVPLQVIASGMAVVGWFLGHKHKGRQFSANVHQAYAPSLMMMLIAQAAMGIYLKLHLERGIHGKIRRYFVSLHGILGKMMPLAAWVQMLFGGITALGFCRAEGDHTGQCLAHFIMGSAFIAYGIVLTILLLVGQFWLRRTGRSQEFFDSLIIAAWGCVNTFTEHRWGHPWGHNDLQHTSMGIVWWCAGLVGIWLSRTRSGRPKRNLLPGIVLILTGYAMSAHPQHLPLSTMIHTIFGYTLMGAGVTRIIEISFVVKDRQTFSDDDWHEPNSFQYIPCFLLFASGFLFMGATEEQMQLLSDAGVTHVSYILILYSFAFLMFLFVNMLLTLYASHAFPEKKKPDTENQVPRMNGAANGHIRANDRRVQDAEEFELHGLMSDDEPDSPTLAETKEGRHAD